MVEAGAEGPGRRQQSILPDRSRGRAGPTPALLSWPSWTRQRGMLMLLISSRRCLRRSSSEVGGGLGVASCLEDVEAPCLVTLINVTLASSSCPSPCSCFVSLACQLCVVPACTTPAHGNRPKGLRGCIFFTSNVPQYNLPTTSCCVPVESALYAAVGCGDSFVTAARPCVGGSKCDNGRGERPVDQELRWRQEEAGRWGPIRDAMRDISVPDLCGGLQF